MNKILIVEDEQSIAEMVKLCLCKNGYMCEIVNDGMAATQKIEEKRYDLILLDIMLPERDGLPDYKYMETLISAIQKLVIKDVVLYADSKIAETKNIIQKR